MPHDVFISYPHESKGIADAACAKLEAEGIRCWIAPRDIAPSAEWAPSIVEAIDHCKLMVLIFSSYSNQSKQVHREVQQAFDGGKPVLPFRIENVLPEKTLRYYMGSVHWLDALSGPVEEHLGKLVSSVAAYLGQSAQREVKAEYSRPKHEEDSHSAHAGVALQRHKIEERKRRKWPSRTPTLVVGSAVITLFVAIIVWLALSPKRPRISANPLPYTQERQLKPMDTFQECSKCPVMKVVPAASFTMGSSADEPERGTDEGPQHKVTISGQFAVAQNEIAFDEWDACVADGGCNAYSPSDESWGRGTRPAINVSWNDAQTYVEWLAETTGKSYQLLSEAEYEYATRAGTTTAYPWGDAIDDNRANCIGCGSKWDGKQTAPVGSFPPNKFGLYDMVGNVWEWTEDCYHESYSGAPADGSAWTSGDCNHRVLRGGSWDDPRGVRSAHRAWGIISVRGKLVGFRVGRTISGP